MTKPRAFSYLRFSTPEQQKGDSFRRQTAMAQAYAAQHGLQLDTALTFEDLGVSAFRGANAEAGRLADFLEAVKAELVPRGSYLLVEALDRLSRLVPRRALKVLESIVEEGITVVTLNDGKKWTLEALDQDPTALLIAVVLMMRANEESATKARRLKAVWGEKRKQAASTPLTAQVPAWIRLDRSGPLPVLRLLPERASIVQGIFRRALAGMGQQGIADVLNADGVPCFGDAPYWRQTYVRKILVNPAAYGTYIPHRYVHTGSKRSREPLDPVPGYYPAAVSQETFEGVQRLRDTAGPSRGKTGKQVSILAGLGICPLCGSTMTRVNKGVRGTPKLVCVKAKAGMGCRYHAVDWQTVEAAIIDNAQSMVHTAPAGDPGAERELEDLLTGIDETQEAIGRLVEAMERAPSSSALADRLQELEVGLKESQQRRDELLLALEATAGPVLRKRLDALERALMALAREGQASQEDRALANAALRAVVRAVVVDWPQGVLRFQWKQGGETEGRYAWPKEAA